MHSLYIKSCHDPKPKIDWFYSNKYDSEFCENLKNGGFIPCGNSGDIVWITEYDKTLCSTFDTDIISMNNKLKCCCFTSGKNCWENKLMRRWACCKEKVGLYTMSEILSIPGCQFIDI
jgi:hypothetical protein